MPGNYSVLRAYLCLSFNDLVLYLSCILSSLSLSFKLCYINSFAGRDRRSEVAAVVVGEPMEEATVGYILSDLKKRDKTPVSDAGGSDV